MQGKLEKYLSDTTSYDYDGLVSEGGKITEKYKIVRNILAGNLKVDKLPVQEETVVGEYGKCILRKKLV